MKQKADKFSPTNTRLATLKAGDRILIRKVGFKGRNKLADAWDEKRVCCCEADGSKYSSIQGET